ncbi:unnamed protein product [Soboliphyme baturini]|uniref:Peptidase A1 domain-containing protein n=1 Tax=Soboliphyme baturini TaxID=241478 RepID=A0A183J5A8_9BILA|nr:unnamed protein product [Soboliphyme baturini]
MLVRDSKGTAVFAYGSCCGTAFAQIARVTLFIAKRSPLFDKLCIREPPKMLYSMIAVLLAIGFVTDFGDAQILQPSFIGGSLAMSCDSDIIWATDPLVDAVALHQGKERCLSATTPEKKACNRGDDGLSCTYTAISEMGGLPPGFYNFEGGDPCVALGTLSGMLMQRQDLLGMVDPTTSPLFLNALTQMQQARQ